MGRAKTQIKNSRWCHRLEPLWDCDVSGLQQMRTLLPDSPYNLLVMLWPWQISKHKKLNNEYYWKEACQNPRWYWKDSGCGWKPEMSKKLTFRHTGWVVVAVVAAIEGGFLPQICSLVGVLFFFKTFLTNPLVLWTKVFGTLAPEQVGKMEADCSYTQKLQDLPPAVSLRLGFWLNSCGWQSQYTAQQN